MDEARIIEKSFHVSKLKLLEVFPLYPFLHGRDHLRIVEVGGNVGQWCEAFHDVFGHRVASYRAYEPMPGNTQQFRTRLKKYRTIHARLKERLTNSKTELIEACVGDNPGKVKIHYDEEVTPLASVAVPYMAWGNAVIDNKHQKLVPQVTLDGEITRPVDLVKIDTEGYEWNVLQGATGIIDSGLVDNIYFEFGGHQGHLGQSFQQFFDFFTERGWQVFRQTVGRNYFGLNAIRKYSPQFEDFSSMWMVLASRRGASEEYDGPRVVGRIN